MTDSGDWAASFFANFGREEYIGIGEIDIFDIACSLDVMEFISSTSSDEDVGVGGMGSGLEIKFIGGKKLLMLDLQRN